MNCFSCIREPSVEVCEGTEVGRSFTRSTDTPSHDTDPEISVLYDHAEQNEMKVAGSVLKQVKNIQASLAFERDDVRKYSCGKENEGQFYQFENYFSLLYKLRKHGIQDHSPGGWLGNTERTVPPCHVGQVPAGHRAGRQCGW